VGFVVNCEVVVEVVEGGVDVVDVVDVVGVVDVVDVVGVVGVVDVVDMVGVVGVVDVVGVVGVVDVIDVGDMVVIKIFVAVRVIKSIVGLEEGVAGVGLRTRVWFPLEVIDGVGVDLRFRLASEYECQLNYQHALTSLTGNHTCCGGCEVYLYGSGVGRVGASQ
jgi:hypothetical protein